jgi:hypothetical protein
LKYDKEESQFLKGQEQKPRLFSEIGFKATLSLDICKDCTNPCIKQIPPRLRHLGTLPQGSDVV